MRLLFLGFPHGSTHYQSDSVDLWMSGEERDVPQATGEYLMSTFGSAFRPTGSAVHAAVLSSAPKGTAAGAPHNDVLDMSTAKLRKALATGDHDGVLDTLEAAERTGKKRANVLALLAARKRDCARG